MVLLSPEARHSGNAATIAVVADDVYCVMNDRQIVGYVHKVGNVYVALEGENVNHAVEVGQSLSWDTAVNMIHFR